MKRVSCLAVAFVLLGLMLPIKVQGALDVPGKSALLMDVATGTVLFEQNAHEPLPPASVTKVMTMLLIMEAIDDGRICWEDTVTASETAAGKGGSQIFLKAGENDAAVAINDLVILGNRQISANCGDLAIFHGQVSLKHTLRGDQRAVFQNRHSKITFQ